MPIARHARSSAFASSERCLDEPAIAIVIYTAPIRHPRSRARRRAARARWRSDSISVEDDWFTQRNRRHRRCGKQVRALVIFGSRARRAATIVVASGFFSRQPILW
jgi:hypothetical protein